MIDVVERGKKEVELVMHFVNQYYNPTMSPVIKRYRMTLDQTSQDFLVALQREITSTSHLVTKVANAYYALNPAGASSHSGFQKEDKPTEGASKKLEDVFEVEAIDQKVL
jgi:hypothetical protein